MISFIIYLIAGVIGFFVARSQISKETIVDIIVAVAAIIAVHLIKKGLLWVKNNYKKIIAGLIEFLLMMLLIIGILIADVAFLSWLYKSHPTATVFIIIAEIIFVIISPFLEGTGGCGGSVPTSHSHGSSSSGGYHSSASGSSSNSRNEPSTTVNFDNGNYATYKKEGTGYNYNGKWVPDEYALKNEIWADEEMNRHR